MKLNLNGTKNPVNWELKNIFLLFYPTLEGHSFSEKIGNL